MASRLGRAFKQARTKQYHEDLARKAKERPAIEPLCIGGFEAGSVITEMSFKEPQDILDKAKRPSIKEVKDWFDVEHVRDSFRFRTQVENLSDLPNLLEALKSSGFEIIKPDFEKLLNPKNRGWRIVALDLRAPNGQIVEYQILPREMQEAGKLEHEIYKAWRGKDTEKLSSTEKAMKLEADQEAAKLYKTAWLNYLKRTGQTENSVQQIIDETRKTINKW